jgi:hypothetical protein
MMTDEKTEDCIGAVICELRSAREAFPCFASAHEGYAILLEEVDELWDEVKKSPRKRDPRKMRYEAVQVAAMAIRFLIDVCEDGER